MGRKARGIVEGSGVKVDELIEMLRSAFADEWIATYYYNLLAELVKGPESPEVADRIKKVAEEELEHQRELAERIIQLGGEPPKSFDELVKIAGCPKVDIPSDLSDVRAVAKAIVEAERCAIEVYDKILRWLMSVKSDPVTFHIIRHILQEEIEHEEEFETIGGE